MTNFETEGVITFSILKNQKIHPMDLLELFFNSKDILFYFHLINFENKKKNKKISHQISQFIFYFIKIY